MTLNTGLKRVLWPLNMWSLKINRDHLLIGRNPCTKFGIDQVKGSKDIDRTKLWAQKSGLILTFEHVTLKINRNHLLIEGNPCTKFGIDQIKGSKDIERTTPWAQKIGLTLTFEHVPLKRDHLLIAGNPCTKFGIDQVKGSKDIERTKHGLQTDRPTNRHTDRPTVAKQYSPFSRRNSSETAQQKYVKLCRYEGHNVKMGISTENFDSMLSGQCLYEDQQFDLCVWPCHLKINKEHLLSLVNIWIKFSNYQAKGSFDIEQTTIEQKLAV